MKEVKAMIQKVVIHFRQDCNLSAAKTLPTGILKCSFSN